MERVAKDKILVPDVPKGYKSNHLISEMLTSSTTIQEPFFSTGNILLHLFSNRKFIFKIKPHLPMEF